MPINVQYTLQHLTVNIQSGRDNTLVQLEMNTKLVLIDTSQSVHFTDLYRINNLHKKGYKWQILKLIQFIH